MKTKSKIALIIILLLAAFLRLGSLWYVEFKNDEANNSFLAVDFIYKGIFPLAGNVSSAGGYHPPMFTYLLAPSFLLSKNPVAVCGYIALLNILAVYLCFLFCREFFNERAALIASAFFAVNPWVILNSRKIWSYDLMYLFIIAFFYTLYKVIFKRQKKFILLSFLFLAIFTQLHLTSISYVYIFFLALIISKPKIKPVYYLAGAGIFLLLYSPYITYDIKNHFCNLEVLLRYSKLPAKVNLYSFFYFFKLATTRGFIHSFYFPILDRFTELLLAGAIVYLLCHLTNKKYLFLLFWAFIPVISLSLSKIPPAIWYFNSLFPIQFILMGVAADIIIKKFKNKFTLFKYIILATLLILVFYQLGCSFNFFNNYIKGQKNVLWMGYGPPFKYRVDEIKQIMKAGCRDPWEIHQKIAGNKNSQARFKYDFGATKYIVENIDSISP
ncbi:MAG: glycosyltransferase family 39 protein [Candidatus Omnitrophica bacterium]|nr:glycosyltransferase family 39 protein [Candidatus Omnitrophota bacterium]